MYAFPVKQQDEPFPILAPIIDSRVEKYINRASLYSALVYIVKQKDLSQLSIYTM